MTSSAACELAVVGAGPAGLAAATLASQIGLDAVVLDEQREPGGQIYRAVTTTPAKNRAILGADYWHGEGLVAQFHQSAAKYLAGATVWMVSRSDAGEPFEIAYSVDGAAGVLRARQILLATGAQERPFPIPGWTLPGVIGAGAAQILLKSAGVVPAGNTVLAGCGPLLYLIAWQYLNAGVRLSAILETIPKGRLAAALPHAWDFIRSEYFAKGVRLLRAVKSAIPVHKAVTGLAAEGEHRVERVRFTVEDVQRSLPADQLLLHQGVVPNINLSNAIGCEQQWNEPLACWEPKSDAWGTSSVLGVWIAGDGAGIAGARAAELRGRISALGAAAALGRIAAGERDRQAATLRKALAAATRGRRFIDTLYQPPREYRIPKGETIVCRCEEVTAAQVRGTVKLGCTGPNQMKAFLRCGMGPCQGRFCGLTVTEVIAEERGVDAREVGYYRLRFPTKPLTLGELASLPQTPQSIQAVLR
jgi:thioredoxin reductase/bacterioferritin-associated ferredoxin